MLVYVRTVIFFPSEDVHGSSSDSNVSQALDQGELEYPSTERHSLRCPKVITSGMDALGHIWSLPCD
jgi:hypothetical protein